jgi:hypothetical protein
MPCDPILKGSSYFSSTWRAIYAWPREKVHDEVEDALASEFNDLKFVCAQIDKKIAAVKGEASRLSAHAAVLEAWPCLSILDDPSAQQLSLAPCPLIPIDFLADHLEDT